MFTYVGCHGNGIVLRGPQESQDLFATDPVCDLQGLHKKKPDLWQSRLKLGSRKQFKPS